LVVEQGALLFGILRARHAEAWCPADPFPARVVVELGRLAVCLVGRVWRCECASFRGSGQVVLGSRAGVLP
jgi:hypothetical protein